MLEMNCDLQIATNSTIQQDVLTILIAQEKKGLVINTTVL